MSGFDDRTIDLVERLRECADIDAIEGAEPSVVQMTREAADEIERLRGRRSIPEGFVIMPREPTPEMINTVCNLYLNRPHHRGEKRKSAYDYAKDDYQAWISSRPSQEK